MLLTKLKKSEKTAFIFLICIVKYKCKLNILEEEQMPDYTEEFTTIPYGPLGIISLPG